jgi:iron complex transport system substrate-binding protein
MVSRREFLKDTGLVFGGVVLGSLPFLAACSATKETITQKATSTVTSTQTNTVTSTATATTTQHSTTTETVTATPTITTPATKQVVDMTGHTIVVPTNLTRLAVPGGTEYTILMALGRDQDIVAANTGIVTTNKWMKLVSPSSADATVAFGPTNIEALAQSQPELIITYNGDSFAQQYTNSKLTYFMVGANETRQHVKAEVAALASLLGETERGDAYVNYFDEKTAYLNDGMGDLADDDRPTVLGVYTYDDNQTFRTAGTGMAQNSDIHDGGGINAAAELQGFGTITVEQIAQWDAEYIIYNGTAAQMEAFKTMFPSLKAVLNDHVYLEPGGVWGWSGISAENILQPLYLATILHPDRFPNLDIRDEVKYFYQNFYDFSLSDAQVTAIMNKEDPPQA